MFKSYFERTLKEKIILKGLLIPQDPFIAFMLAIVCVYLAPDQVLGINRYALMILTFVLALGAKAIINQVFGFSFLNTVWRNLTASKNLTMRQSSPLPPVLSKNQTKE